VHISGRGSHLCHTRRVPAPRLEITYCTQCRWLLRAGWTAQELLTTFPADLGEVALVPGTGGVFQVRLDDELLWDRGAEGGFPELSRLKQLVRDRVAPDRTLGHSDRR
jgi:selenoprotein W-related protein